MTRVRCPMERCIYWLNGWCDADEIELDPETLACITYEEFEPQTDVEVADLADLEWDEAEPIFEEEMDERLYDVTDFVTGEDDEDEEEDELAFEFEEEDGDWRLA